MTASLADRVRLIVAGRYGHYVHELTDDMDLTAALAVTPLDRLNITLQIERECGVVFPDEALASFKTVADLVALTLRHAAVPPSPARPLTQAMLAATTICPRIVHTVALAGHGPVGDRVRQLREAQRHARELLTRLEIAELETVAAGHDDRRGEEAA